jgi:hypothetical protein
MLGKHAVHHIDGLLELTASPRGSIDIENEERSGVVHLVARDADAELLSVQVAAH